MAITEGAEPPKEKSKVPLLDDVPLNEPVAVKADRIPGFADAADQSSGIEKLAHARPENTGRSILAYHPVSPSHVPSLRAACLKQKG